MYTDRQLVRGKVLYILPRCAFRPTKSHALGVSLMHLSVISRSHAWHLPYHANLTHFSQKSSKWAWFANLRMRSSQFNELAQEFAVAI